MGTISVSLPTDGTTADVSDYNTPITTIVNAINGGLDNSNIATGAAIATSKLASDNGITAAMISTSAIAQIYTPITSNFTTTSSTAVQVTGLTASPTIPAGGRKIKISVFASDIFANASSVMVLTLWDGVVGSGTQLARCLVNNGGTTGVTFPVFVQSIVTPAAGPKTYNVGLSTSAGTATLEAGATYPAFILVEAI